MVILCNFFFNIEELEGSKPGFFFPVLGLWRCHSDFSASQNEIPGGNKLGNVTKHKQDVFAKELSQEPEFSPAMGVCAPPTQCGLHS